MCLLTYYPAGVGVDTEALDNGATFNDDGHGFAIVTRDRLIIRKSMTAWKLIDQFAEIREEHKDGPALFHSRLATSGDVTTKQCHPFFVGNDPLTVVGHNGIISHCTPKKSDPRSDTQIFAEHHLPQRNLDGARSRKKLAKWLQGDKIVVLTVNPDYKANAYLINERYGFWEDGVWYSNRGYRSYASTWSYAAGWSGKVSTSSGVEKSGVKTNGRDILTCKICGYSDVPTIMLTCWECRSCFECGQGADVCMCYVPENLMASSHRSGYWCDVCNRFIPADEADWHVYLHVEAVEVSTAELPAQTDSNRNDA